MVAVPSSKGVQVSSAAATCGWRRVAPKQSGPRLPLPRNPSLQYDSTRTRHRQQIPIPRGLRLVTRERAVRTVIADEDFQLEKKAHPSRLSSKCRSSSSYRSSRVRATTKISMYQPAVLHPPLTLTRGG